MKQYIRFLGKIYTKIYTLRDDESITRSTTRKKISRFLRFSLVFISIAGSAGSAVCFSRPTHMRVRVRAHARARTEGPENYPQLPAHTAKFD